LQHVCLEERLSPRNHGFDRVCDVVPASSLSDSRLQTCIQKDHVLVSPTLDARTAHVATCRLAVAVAVAVAVQ
jgi:hypothetical protein